MPTAIFNPASPVPPSPDLGGREAGTEWAEQEEEAQVPESCFPQLHGGGLSPQRGRWVPGCGAQRGVSASLTLGTPLLCSPLKAACGFGPGCWLLAACSSLLWPHLGVAVCPLPRPV